MSGRARNRWKVYLALIAVAVVGFVMAFGTHRKKAPDRVTGSCADTPACRECRAKATANFCKSSYVAPQASGDIKVNGAKGCCGFEDPTLRKNCENILSCIHSHDCSHDNSPVFCLCGTATYMKCAYAMDWDGPCTSAYKAALAGGPPGTVMKLFGDPRSPIGVANNTFTCDVDAACPCGQSTKKK